MDEMLWNLRERIEKTRRQLYKAKTKTALIMVSRRMDSLINLYMRLSCPAGPGGPAGHPDPEGVPATPVPPSGGDDPLSVSVEKRAEPKEVAKTPDTGEEAPVPEDLR